MLLRCADQVSRRHSVVFFRRSGRRHLQVHAQLHAVPPYTTAQSLHTLHDVMPHHKCRPQTGTRSERCYPKMLWASQHLSRRRITTLWRPCPSSRKIGCERQRSRCMYSRLLFMYACVLAIDQGVGDRRLCPLQSNPARPHLLFTLLQEAYGVAGLRSLRQAHFGKQRDSNGMGLLWHSEITERPNRRVKLSVRISTLISFEVFRRNHNILINEICFEGLDALKMPCVPICCMVDLFGENYPTWHITLYNCTHNKRIILC
jgi:hypothetical protein